MHTQRKHMGLTKPQQKGHKKTMYANFTVLDTHKLYRKRKQPLHTNNKSTIAQRLPSDKASNCDSI